MLSPSATDSYDWFTSSFHRIPVISPDFSPLLASWTGPTYCLQTPNGTTFRNEDVATQLGGGGSQHRRVDPMVNFASIYSLTTGVGRPNLRRRDGALDVPSVQRRMGEGMYTDVIAPIGLGIMGLPEVVQGTIEPEDGYDYFDDFDYYMGMDDIDLDAGDNIELDTDNTTTNCDTDDTVTTKAESKTLGFWTKACGWVVRKLRG